MKPKRVHGAKLTGQPKVLGRFDLPAEQVKFQIGVHCANLGRVICVSVMALGKNIDGINVRRFDRSGKSLRIEVRANPLALQRGVKVKMNLAKAVNVRHGVAPVLHEAAGRARLVIRLAAQGS